MVTLLKAVAFVILALWSGTMFCIGFVVAPYLFGLAAEGDPNVPDREAAGNLMGPLLSRTDLVGVTVAVPLLLVCLVLLRLGKQIPLGGRYFICEIFLLLAGGCAAVNHWVLTPMIHTARQSLATRYDGLQFADASDPVYESFSTLHYSATVLFVAAFSCSVLAMICLAGFRSSREAD